MFFLIEHIYPAPPPPNKKNEGEGGEENTNYSNLAQERVE